MLTVKLCKGHVIKVVEAVEVDIYPCGRVDGSDDNPSLRTNKVREISVKGPSGQEVYYVASNGGETAATPPGTPVSSFLPHHAGPLATFWDCAYIENSQGATVEKIRPY